MVSALLNDALTDPCSVIRSFASDNALNYTSGEFPARVAEHFKSIFRAEDAFKQIPPLDVFHPPDNYVRRNRSLVRFRAMIQDTSLSPEIYPSVLADGTFGGWGSAELSVPDDDHQATLGHAIGIGGVMKERENIWAISIPGESPFISQILDDDTFSPSATKLFRNKCQHKDPLMRGDHIGLPVKIYDPNGIGSLKPTDIYTFVGLLMVEGDDSAGDNCQDAVAPMLHTIFSVKHPSTLIDFGSSSLGLLPNEGDASEIQQHSSTTSSPSSSFVRDRLISWIANQALDGDREAATWVLLTCISKVQSRQPPLFPLSVTLSRFPGAEKIKVDAVIGPPTPTTGPALTHILRSLLPIFVEIPLSLSLINDRPFHPECHNDDDDDNDLHSGLLQLPAGCTVLVTEGDIKEGRINASGIKNIQTLRNVLTLQTLDYQFPFTAPYQFPTDLSFIVLAEGKASPFVQTQINVPLNCKDPGNIFRRPEEITFPSPSVLNAYRRLVGEAMTGQVQVTEEISEHIQADFVAERQAKPATTADDLMMWMTIARLLALSHHKSVLTREVWEEAKELDRRRKDRMG